MESVLGELLKNRKLPDLFEVDGQKIIDKDGWEKIARPYWRNQLLTEEYGQMPPVLIPQISAKTNPVDFAGKAVWEEVTFTFENNGKQHVVPTQLIYPADNQKHPFFIYLNFRPDIPDRYLPVEELLDNGFGVFAVCYNDVTPDNADFSVGLPALFQQSERKGADAGKIIYWSYMASRMMDYLLTRPQANEKSIGISGHSRLGKTALLTAALDERFAFVCSNNSGCSGAAIARGCSKQGEHIRNILGTFPYWFCPNYTKYIDKEQELPFDQHCLIALVAPRGVYIGGALQDVWADNDSQFLSCVAASKAWNLYGKAGIITPDKLFECGDTLIQGDVGFHLRSGKHYHSRTDWLIYMEAAKKYLQRNNL